jgi:hypothetical protein
MDQKLWCMGYLAPSTRATGKIIIGSYLKGGAKATLFLSAMSKPRHGTLNQSSDQSWLFYPGKSTVGTLLPDLPANCQHLLDTGQLFRGHAKFKNFYSFHNNLSLWDCVL